LNIHLHSLVLDGVYRCGDEGVPSFVEVDAPTDDELHTLLQSLITRLMKMLTRRGVLVEEMGQTRPEQTTLYRLMQQHAASFIAHTEASTGAELPRFIKDEFDAFLECGILAHGFCSSGPQ
jgi:hypothetical protein